MMNDISMAGCAHQVGTCRFGMDPVTSAFNADCRAQLDNLYVADTSVFPSIRVANPALTAMANALRACFVVLDRIGLARRRRNMDNEDAELDRLQGAYKSAVDTWVAAIRAEEALSSGDHNLAQVDKWEAAHFVAEEARHKAHAAKVAYEGAIRSKFFGMD